mmetsp:Transcript_29220/g.56442  ORF Transcript_29220/g.56442 Transcript_29220/m.56442 type:complete len:217 (+) Transcript_29220:474-1124(+)
MYFAASAVMSVHVSVSAVRYSECLPACVNMLSSGTGQYGFDLTLGSYRPEMWPMSEESCTENHMASVAMATSARAASAAFGGASGGGASASARVRSAASRTPCVLMTTATATRSAASRSSSARRQKLGPSVRSTIAWKTIADERKRARTSTPRRPRVTKVASNGSTISTAKLPHEKQTLNTAESTIVLLSAGQIVRDSGLSARWIHSPVRLFSKPR